MDKNSIKRHAFLIMAHNNFETLSKLLGLLDSCCTDLFIHIDKKVRTYDKDLIKRLVKCSNVYFAKNRIDVKWGTQSQVITELCLFNLAHSKGPYWYYHLISGNDLPLKPINEILNFFENSQVNYLLCEDKLSKYDYQRISLYRKVFGNYTVLNNHSYNLQLKYKVDRVKNLRKKFPEIKKGWNWCDLTEDAVSVILSNQRVIKSFTRYSLCADEMYKQIIIVNTNLQIHPHEMHGDMLTDGIRYIVWDGGNHPKTLNSNDLDNMLKSGLLFARKFDENADNRVIEALYKILKGQQS